MNRTIKFKKRNEDSGIRKIFVLTLLFVIVAFFSYVKLKEILKENRKKKILVYKTELLDLEVEYKQKLQELREEYEQKINEKKKKLEKTEKSLENLK